MQGINITGLRQLFKNVTDRKLLQLMVERFNKNFRPKINIFDFENLLHIAHGINEHQVCLNAQESHIRTSQKSQIFFNRELKLFCWTLILLCLQKRISVNHLLAIEIEEIRNIFIRKSAHFLSFQLQSIYYSRKRCEKPWKEDQIMLLSNIIKKDLASQWKQRAFLLFCLSDGNYFRTFQSCRENWINHLNPKINKGPWTAAEDLKVMEFIRIHGPKWALISKLMGQARSQHSIKNRIKSLLNNLKKQDPNIDLEDMSVIIQMWQSLQAQKQKIEPLSEIVPKIQEDVKIKCQPVATKEESQPLNEEKMSSQATINVEKVIKLEEESCLSQLSLDRVDNQFKKLMSWKLQENKLQSLQHNYQEYCTQIWIEPINYFDFLSLHY